MQPSSLKSMLWRIICTACSYDFTIALPIWGMWMTRLGKGDAAPDVTSLMDALSFLQFSAVLPMSFELSQYLDQLDEIPGQDRDRLREKIARTPKNGLAAGMICLPLIFSMTYAEPMLKALGQDPKICRAADDFFKVYWPFFLLYAPRFTIESILLCGKQQVPAMVIANSCLLISLVIGYLGAFEKPLGVAGLALGSGVGAALTLLGFMGYIACHFEGIPFLRRFFTWNDQDWKQIKRFIKAGAPTVASALSDISVNFVISVLAGRISDEAAKMQNAATQLLNVNALMVAAAGYIAGVSVGEQRGKGTLKSVARTGLLANFILQLPLACFVSCFPDAWIDLVGASVERAETRHLLWVTVAYMLIDGVRYNTLQTLRADEDSLIPSVISSCGLWLGVLFSYALSDSLGVMGLPLGLLIGSSFAALCLQWRQSSSQERAEQQPLLFFGGDALHINGTEILADGGIVC